MSEPLKYMSDNALEVQRTASLENPEIYFSQDFSREARSPSWDISLAVNYDRDRLAELDLTLRQNIAAIDLKNSRVVGEALSELTPSLASEERVWARLAHTDGLVYSRVRWLDGKSGDDLRSSVRVHLFAPNQTNIRDDHALARLWWNWHIAKTCWPENPERALELILSTADVRSNFVERFWMSSRRNIASATLRAMDTNNWITAREKNFREFMKALNRFGGGIVFEALDEQECDGFVEECVYIAKAAAA